MGDGEISRRLRFMGADANSLEHYKQGQTPVPAGSFVSII